jgi:predicted ATPase/DNA-binding XRE family transcriptional regulator/Tfp pilus assembly protein PilF
MTAEPDLTFAQLLRQARREAGLTQEELAEQAGISPRAVSSLERGINRAPRRDTLELIFAALDLPPDEQAQWERLRRQQSLRSPSGPSADHPAAQQNVHLPTPLTSFLGRERELEEARQTLAESRLVTITGPGGMGKTRLAIKLASTEHQNYPDGVFFIPLAATERPDLVAIAILRALGLDESADRSPVETLEHFLRERSLLLLLDNFEHVASAAPLVSELLEACPRINALVTSRIPLRLSGEKEYLLRPLSHDRSAALFVDRSREIQPAFDPDDGQAATIDEICRRLDGLPLAIELAAARGRVLTPRALLDRLEHPLDILSGGPRDAPRRQQTLRDTIAWSYDLLHPEAQTLFLALAVFRDGWSLEAAEAVGPAGIDILDGMTALVESNLIELHSESSDEPRFRMLETIREFGLDLLQTDDSGSTARERHARYMADLVQAAPPFLRGPDQIYWLNRLEVEHANIRLALDWHLTHDVEAGLRMLAALWRFWWMHSHLTLGRRYFDEFLDRSDDSMEPATLASALTGAGVMTLYESDLARDRAEAQHEQALSIWLDLHDPPEGGYWSYLCLGIIESRRGNLPAAEARFQQCIEYAQCHNQPAGVLGGYLLLANQLAWRGHPEQATSHFQAALSIAREFQDPWMIALNSMNLARMLAREGRYEEAWALANEAVGLSQQLKHTRDVSWALNGMAEIEISQGRLSEAKMHLEQALEYAQKTGDTHRVSAATCDLGTIALRSGEFQEAAELFRKSLDSCLVSGNIPGTAEAIDGLATTMARLGNPRQAVQLHAAAIAFCERVGIATPDADRSALEHEYVTVQQFLSITEFDEAWQTGNKLTPDQFAAQTQRSPVV